MSLTSLCDLFYMAQRWRSRKKMSESFWLRQSVTFFTALVNARTAAICRVKSSGCGSAPNRSS
jgi:hypothetical protein